MEIVHFQDVHLGFFYALVNKLMTFQTQNIFYLIVEHSRFIKYV